MDKIENVLKYSELLSLYQNLLSPTQKEILEDYFYYNLSLSEIAENRKISRSAVEDAIKKGKAKLDSFENKIGSLKVLHEITALRKIVSDKKVIAKLDDIERIMKHGI